MQLTRRGLMIGSAAAAVVAPAFRFDQAFAGTDKLTIAYHVSLPSFDPTTGPSAVNPTIQSIYQSVFDLFIDQAPDLAQAPGIIEKWGYSDDKSQIWMQVRKGVVWHDGSPLTPEDVVWSLERAGNKDSGNPIQFIWSKASNFKIDGQKVTADMKEYEPTYFKWMSFLTGYILPKAYYTKVGAEGFEAKPVGSGPYMVDQFDRNAFLRLKANPNYWKGKPAIDTVIFKFVTDASSRVAEIESGSSDVTLEIPYEEFDRLKGKAGLQGITTPISDIGMIFITDVEPMLDKNVRLALSMSIDKKAIVDQLLHGYGVPLNTLQAPQYSAYDASIVVPYDPKKAAELMAASGYSKDKPVKFRIQTTRGFKPKDYEMVQAIAGMWRKIGAEAEIEVYEIAKHYELRATHKLAPAAFYNWGNSIGDPSTSTGFSMFGLSPHCAWHGKDTQDMIGPLWGEKDEAKRIAGYKAVDKYIADNGEVIPLLQYVQPILFKDTVKVTPHVSGALLPGMMT